MTSLDSLNLADTQSMSAEEAAILNQISPDIGKSSTIYPIIGAVIIAILAWGLSSEYFINFFKSVPYLSFAQAGIIFSATLIAILFLT